MYNIRKISDDLYWLGANDRRLALFENVYPIPSGISYNSYILTDEKNVLFDTVDSSVSEQFFANLEYVLQQKSLDYLVINHMEPDHCSQILRVADKYPSAKLVCNAKTKQMIAQFFQKEMSDERFVIVKEGDVLNTGKHELTFVMAPMVHWPEVMVTYDKTAQILFSADAFGTFGALNGNIFAHEVDFANTKINQARRYYTNIVGKYGPQVLALLNKASALKIKMICPLHGYIWQTDLEYIIEKYTKWAAYEAEENGVMIAYGSIYGNTENAAEILAAELALNKVKNIQMYDVSVTHFSYILADAFKYSHLVFAAPTYNGEIFVNMNTLLKEIVAHNLQNRTIGLISNGSWADMAGKQIKEELQKLKNCHILEQTVSLKSSLNEAQLSDIKQMAKQLAI